MRNVTNAEERPRRPKEPPAVEAALDRAFDEGRMSYQRPERDSRLPMGERALAMRHLPAAVRNANETAFLLEVRLSQIRRLIERDSPDAPGLSQLVAWCAVVSEVRQWARAQAVALGEPFVVAGGRTPFDA